MRKDKEDAYKLRQEGKSYNEIYQKLKIPRATLSDWFSTIDWSQAVKENLVKSTIGKSKIRIQELNKIRGMQLSEAYDEARVEARSEFADLKYNPLFIAGIMLYWGEGDKLTKHSTRLTNTDPTLIRLFVMFLQKACRIPSEKIRANVLIYPDLDADTCVQYWAEQAALAESDFTKCIRIQGRHKTKRLSHGVCMINVSSSYFKVKMLEWIRLLPHELMNREYYESI